MCKNSEYERKWEFVVVDFYIFVFDLYMYKEFFILYLVIRD